MGIRVFHCDDSEAFTRLVAFWLAEHDDIEHVGEAHTAESAERATSILDYRPDLGTDYVDLAGEVLKRIGQDAARKKLQPLRA